MLGVWAHGPAVIDLWWSSGLPAMRGQLLPRAAVHSHQQWALPVAVCVWVRRRSSTVRLVGGGYATLQEKAGPLDWAVDSAMEVRLDGPAG